jgi:large subunit ribosomal protein L5
MNFIENFYLNTLKYDLANKFFYKNTKDIPKIKKIILNFGCKTTDIKRLSACLLALELVASKKGMLTTTKKANIILKVRKGNPVGCKLTLRNKPMFSFLDKILNNIFPNTKNFTGIKLKKLTNVKYFSYEFHETFAFKELEEHYYLFNNLPNLSVTLVTNTKKKDELIFILKSLQFPLI